MIHYWIIVIKSAIEWAIVFKKWLTSESVQNGKYLKSKTKPYESEINTTFPGGGTPKEGFYCIILSAIGIDSVFKSVLEQCKYILKRKR